MVEIKWREDECAGCFAFNEVQLSDGDMDRICALFFEKLPPGGKTQLRCPACLRAERLAAAYERLRAEIIAHVDVHANLDLFAIIQTIDAIEKEPK
jgi:hypothetical protein